MRPPAFKPTPPAPTPLFYRLPELAYIGLSLGFLAIGVLVL